MTAPSADLDPSLAKALSDVVAVAHAGDGQIVIWHVDVGPDNGLARMAGAWVVEFADAETASTLLRGRRILATAEARAAVEELGVPIAGFLDPDATLAGIGEETGRLQEAFEEAMVGRKTKLVNPSWPAPPAPLEIASDEDPVAVTLGLARWLEGLARVWEKVEAQRVTRKFLAPELGRDRRPLAVRF